MTYAIAKMNMIIHDMEGEVAIGDTLRNPKFLKNSKLRTFDLVAANPMWNQDAYNDDFYDSDTHDRFAFGYAPASSADWGWVQHMLASLNANGRAVVVLDTGAVIIATAVDGVVPTLKSNLPEDEREASYNEQRRLFFVAITRSSDELVISGPKRMTYADARGVGARIGKTWRRRDGELIAECFAAPYLRELGPNQPAAQVGLKWLPTALGSKP